MPKKKQKPVKEMTTNELAERVFGKKLKKELQTLAKKPTGKQ
jgi:hypothetical protein